ncbi:hypothetical protein JTE90_020694 [Oedothorax gibbosus]|uniref:Ig-like domain-containing protein n=1 Tax=Oedothorax gibbosus TaxID=931172 RepID=A0AAV6V3U5_9ARAC|nr:hypothetical protein JTE90_020694 [Oedothorax gibbosus]
MSGGCWRNRDATTPLLLLLIAAQALLADCKTFPASLQIHSLHVPTPVSKGDSALLRCVYELGSEPLYAVKWYKDEREFFRYVPETEPAMKVFARNGLDVDVSSHNCSEM